MSKGSTDWIAAGVAILMVLWVGKTYNLMPFIYCHAPCAEARQEPTS